MKLIPDWRDAWRWISTWAFIAAGALQSAWVSVSPDMRASIPEGYVSYATMVIVVVGAVGRMVNQK